MAKAVKMAHEAGIPVIAYDRIIRDSDLDLYVSFDNERVGELQAKFLVDHLPTPGKGRIVRIYGAKTDNNASLFKRGQDRVLEPYIARGDIVVVHEDWAEDWKPENAKRIVNAAITASGPGIDAVLASNDGTAGGAIQALSEEGLAGKVLVTGQDADTVALQRIAAGTQAMTIYKPLKTLARGAAELAVQVACEAPRRGAQHRRQRPRPGAGRPLRRRHRDARQHARHRRARRTWQPTTTCIAASRRHSVRRAHERARSSLKPAPL